jgi:solute carrier family 25 carnitine/acylcarnitine transporter 20/29
MKNNDDNTIKTLIYKNEIDCAQWVIKNEGLLSLCTHGLWITIIREIPSFAIYFAVYGWLQHTSLATRLGYHIAPLIFGAIAGWAMWIPTYPIDVVKTIEQVQTRERNSDKDMLTWRQITAKLYRTGGVGAFFEGLEPKLARAAIKHAVTFWCYEVLMNIMRPESIY